MHLSSVWSSLVSWWLRRRSVDDLRRQVREARAASRQLGREYDDLDVEFKGLFSQDSEHLRDIEELMHTIRMHESRIEMQESELRLLAAVIERDIQRVKSEKANYMFQEQRLMDTGVSAEE